MVCKKCGGELHYIDEAYVCQSCGVNISIADYYEDIDAFICYIESDSTGRRTKDSIIAQKIYHNLESKKIKTFYSRISASDLFGDDLQVVCNSAIKKSKAIIILGSQKEYFEVLLSKYSDFFAQKVVIPVYIDMDAYHMPKNISTVQALDYNKVGADADLTKALLRALNREEELTYEQLSKKSSNKKVIIIAIIIAILILASAVALYLFLKEKGSVSETDNLNSTEAVTEETAPEDPNLSLYNEAIAFMENEEYEKAIINLSQLSGYKDSDKQLQIILEKYAGYYKNDDTSISFHLQILSGNTATIEISSIVNEKRIQISESSQISSNKISIKFNDSENNQGTIMIEFKDKSIDMSIKTETANSDTYINDINISFLTDEKSDKPFAEQIDQETLLGFVKSRTTLRTLAQKSFDVVFDTELSRSGVPSRYKIKNTDIYFSVYNYDISKTDSYYGDSETNVDDSIAFGVCAPASLIIPEYIGESNAAFVEDDILYVPNGELSQNYHVIEFGILENIKKGIINENTSVCFTSRSLIGDRHFEELVDYYIGSDKSNNNITESPNVWCPNCKYGFFTTGVGIDGFTCSQCSCNWLPMCYICHNENAVSIKSTDSDMFTCNLCGQEWTP